LVRLCTKIANDREFEEKVQEKVQVGIHWSTEVAGGSHEVCQVLCSAVPVAFMKNRSATVWQGFASALLMAAYDATLTLAALLAAERGERVKVYLTALGGGELGNRQKWVYEALDKVLHLHEKEPLDVMLIHYAEVPAQYSLLESNRESSGVSGAALMHTSQVKGMRDSEDFASVQALVGEDDAETLMNVFAHFDTNGDGVLDKAEMMRILQSVDEVFFTEHVVNILFNEADCDGDGNVQYFEFVNWICSEDEDIASAIMDRINHCPSQDCPSTRADRVSKLTPAIPADN